MTTLPMEGARPVDDVEKIAPAALGTPGRVALALHVAIGNIDREGPKEPLAGARASDRGPALTWKFPEDGRHDLVVAQPFDMAKPAIRFRSSPDGDPLVVAHDGTWQRGDERGEIDTLGDFRDLPDGVVKDEALALFSMATLVFTRSNPQGFFPTSGG